MPGPVGQSNETRGGEFPVSHPGVSILAGALRQILRQGVMLAGGLMLIGAVALMADDPLRMFFRLLSLAGTALMLLSVALMLVTFRRARVLAPAALLTTLLASLISTGLSLILSGAAVDPVSAIAITAGGLAMGVGWSLTTLLFIDGEIVRGRGTPWHLMVWALSLAVNQVVAVTGAGNPATATLMMLAGAGLTIGHSLGLIVRVRQAGRWARPAAPQMREV